MKEAYITLLTGKDYLPGVLTLGKSLKTDIKIKRRLAILLDPTDLTAKQIDLIKEIYDDIIYIKDEIIEAPVDKLSAQLNRLELTVTYSKLLLWKQTQYTKLVYLDCDILPLKSSENLFDIELKPGQVAASPDSGWPDIFNSGLMVLVPDMGVYDDLLKFSEDADNTFDGADQGLLNEWFNASRADNWYKLPFVYNVSFSQSYQYRPAFNRFFKSIVHLHFLGASKPWCSSSSDSFQQQWWDAFNKHFSAETKEFILKSSMATTFNANLENYVKNHTNAWDEQDAEPKLAPSIRPVKHALFPWEEKHKQIAPTRIFDE